MSVRRKMQRLNVSLCRVRVLAASVYVRLRIPYFCLATAPEARIGDRERTDRQTRGTGGRTHVQTGLATIVVASAPFTREEEELDDEGYSRARARLLSEQAWENKADSGKNLCYVLRSSGSYYYSSGYCSYSTVVVVVVAPSMFEAAV